MSYVERESTTITTATGGGATGYLGPFTGRVTWLKYTRDDMATGMDLDITGEDTAQEIWDEDNVSATKQVYPRAQAQDTAGGNLDTAGDVTTSAIWLSNERIKVTVANGGNAKSGTFEVLIA